MEGLAARLALALDPVLHLADRRDRRQVHRRAVDGRRHRAHEAPAVGQVAGHGPRLHERRLLPGRGPAVVVLGKRVPRCDQRALPALGSQLEIHPIQEAVRGVVRQQRAELAGQAREVLRRGAATGAVDDLGIGRLERIHEIDVGREVELLPAELAESEHAEAQRQLVAGGRAPDRRTEPRRHALAGHPERAAQDRVGQVRELRQRLADACLGHPRVRTVPDRDARQLGVLEATEQLARVALGLELALDELGVVLGSAGRGQVVRQQCDQALRIATEQARQEGSGPAQRRPDPHRRVDRDRTGCGQLGVEHTARERVGAAERGVGLGAFGERAFERVGQSRRLEPRLELPEPVPAGLAGPAGAHGRRA